MPELPDDEELLAAVRAAGWLLEQHAVRTLDAAGMHPRAGWAFEDPDEPTKSRELDVWSYRQLHADQVNKIYVTARFLVECKQSAFPYVGVGRTLPAAHFRQGNPVQHVMPCPIIKTPLDESGSYRETPAWQHFGFDQVARDHGDDHFRVTQLTRLDREKGGGWSANNSGIFTSLVYPIAKALLASTAQARLSRPRSAHTPRTGWVDFALHFPVVLISAPLYVVDGTTEATSVYRRRWATANRELKSAHVKGIFDIDVVTEDAFTDYIADRLTFARALAELIGSDPLKFTGEK